MAPQSQHPAPGSGVPGAPPALRRELTAQDGASTPARTTAATSATASVAAPHLVPPDGSTGPGRGGSTSTLDHYLTALGLISVAVAIEAGTRRTRAQVLHHATTLKEY
jgi:hypothetical protein